MEQFNFNEDKLIRELNDEFQEKFPYLIIFFFTPEISDAQKENGKKGYLSGDVKLRDFKTKTPQSYKKISFDNQTEIGVLEKSFMEQFALNIQIGCSRKEGEFQYTNDNGDKRTLKELSEKIKKAGYIKNPKPVSYELSEISNSSENSKVIYNYMHPLS
jgi:hypothetical protein